MANQWARPSADVTDGNWLNQAGSNVNLYASLDESPSSIADSDFIRSGASPSNDLARVALGALYPPDAGTATLHLRGYWGNSVAGSEVAFTWSSVADATGYTLQVGPVANSFTLFDSDVGNVLTWPLQLAPGTYYARVVPVGAGSPTALSSLVVT